MTDKQAIYRDWLIRCVQDAGRELIEKAPNWIPKDINLNTEMDICITIPNGVSFPNIQIKFDYAPSKEFLEDYFDTGLNRKG